MNTDILSDNDQLIKNIADPQKTYAVAFNGHITNKNVNWLNGSISSVITQEFITKPEREFLFLIIQSPGGDVDQALMARNFLRSIKEQAKIKIVTYNPWFIGSCAPLLYLEGDVRLAQSNSMFYFHEFFAFPNQSNIKIQELKSRNFMAENHTRIFVKEIKGAISSQYHSYIPQIISSDKFIRTQMKDNKQPDNSIYNDEEKSYKDNILPFSAVECGLVHMVVDNLSWLPNCVCLSLPD